MASNIQPTGLDWKNLPQKTTPISAENLNKMANTIDDLVEAVNPLNTVEANPVGTPTEGLEKVEIDGTLYEVKGGHKILNDSGTTLTQKDNLQFKGVYTQNNGDNTEVDICRTMTKAQMEALSGEALKGFINTSDEPDSLPLTAEWVAYDSNKSVKDKIDDNSTEIGKINNPIVVDSTTIPVSSGGTSYGSMNLYKFSNGMKLLLYRSDTLPVDRLNDIATLPTGYEPLITPLYIMGETKNDYFRAFSITGNKFTAYAQRNSNEGAYLSCYYV